MSLSDGINRLSLTEKEALSQLKLFGKNKLKEKKRPWPIILFLCQFKDLLVIILIISTIISVFMGEMVEAIAILVVVFMNGMFGFLQEYKTEKTLEALKRLSAPYSKVVRDGVLKKIKSEDVVPDDILQLEAGDRISADGLILTCQGFSVDEALLTGESDPVIKVPAPKEQDIKIREAVSKGENIKFMEPVFKGGDTKSKELVSKSENMRFKESISKEEHTKSKEQQHMTFMGTLVLAGNAYVKVINTGMKTQMGKIAGMIDEVKIEQNTLQKKLNRLSKYLAVACIGICICVSLIGIMRGENLFDMLLSGISLAVASIPESLPAVVMVSLAVGVQRMLKRNALIKKLPSVETLGMASVICTDKTGTLTENCMELKTIYVYDKELKSNNDGWKSVFQSANKTTLDSIPNKINFGKTAIIDKFFLTSILCNNASFDPTESIKDTDSKRGSDDREANMPLILGDSFEKALLKASFEAGIHVEGIRKECIRQNELPFDSEKKYMAVTVKFSDGLYLLLKGAPEMVLQKCSFVSSQEDFIKINDIIKRRILNYNDKSALNAYRMLGFAYKKISNDVIFDATAKKDIKDDFVSDLTFLALGAVVDPPRKDVAKAIQNCFKLGIKPIMITGDHKNTAVAIAKETGIFLKGDAVITGDELDLLGEIDLSTKINNVSVFARVSPSHKLKIVKLLKRKGHVVAMTGDGVNDAPAIKMADIGIAMGKSGTDVTKEAASIVLLDDRFSSIMDAVIEGRIIYLNIRKAIMYLLSCNVGEVVTMLLGSIFGFPVILLPIQILWVNLVTDGLPAIGLACDMPDRESLINKKSYNSNNILHDSLTKIIFIRGIMMGLITLGVFMYYMYSTNNLEISRTNAFLSMVMLQLVFAFECRGFKGKSAKFATSVALSFIMALIVVYVPFFQKAFSLSLPGIYEWGLIFGSSLIVPIFKYVFKFLKRGI